jgi:TrmH family RNA methyltransferase
MEIQGIKVYGIREQHPLPLFIMITSVQNPKIKFVRELQNQPGARRAAQAFVVEGVRLVEEALATGWKAQLVLYTADLGARGQKLVEGFNGCGAPVEQVSPQVFQSASDTQTPQGILAVLPIQSLPAPARLDFLLIPDSVRDPGNLGAMLRSACAAGVQAVYIPPLTTDPYAPKVVRAAMGAHFRLPISSLDWPEIRRSIREANLRVYLAAAGEGIPYTQANFHAPLALVVGGEAEGASPAASELADARVHIPMPGGAESLNAAVAAGILLFEVVRQRE